MNLTPQWLETVLQKPVDELRVELIGQFSSTVSRLHVTSRAGPRTLILKQPRHDRDERIGESFIMEGQFYGSVAPLLNIRLPICYGYSDHFIVLEDIDTQAISFKDGATALHLERALPALRALHQAMPETDLDWIPNFADAEFNNALASEFNLGWENNRVALLELCPEFAAVGDHLHGRMQEYYARLGRQPTLLQGDAHLENIPLMNGSSEVVFFDWQGPRIGDGVFDAAYFLVMSLTSEERRQSEMLWLSTYSGAEVSRDLWLSYRTAVAARASGIVEISARHPDILSVAGGFPMVAKRCLVAAVDHAVQEIVR
ncbi:MAG: phosphotransferase [Gammaproteobacteria bacterium]|nr:phosphotransferase [Gammaproteobacteria bacterium]